MIKKALPICVLSIVQLLACNQNSPVTESTLSLKYPIKIDLIKAMTNQKDIKLSDIADSIAYIQLKNVKEKPVGVILDFKYFQNNIFVHIGGQDGGFYRFDNKGNFLNEISSKGRGPGQYLPGSTYSVIDNPERFFILCNFAPRNLLEFDYDGNLLTKILTADPSVGGFEAVSFDRFLFLASSIQRLDTSVHYMACLKDRKNLSIMTIDHPFFSKNGIKKLDSFFYEGAGAGAYYDKMPLFYDKNSMDTIYSINNDTIYPKYIIDKGIEGAPFEKLYSHTLTPERYNYLSPFSITETTKDVFILSIFKNKELYLINYNKESQSVSYMKTPYVVPDLDHIRQTATVHPKFENDIDGGISIVPGKTNREGDVWLYKYDALDFKNKLTKEHFLNSKAIFPDRKKALIQLVDSIKDFDNPILMVVFLKK